ncbi:hypothetical protein NC651_011975 [Populus alba x Populus x berolinensis]|nr:hypothetical protein NC651_011975 [Populus alba x Populus x berolinensis]
MLSCEDQLLGRGKKWHLGKSMVASSNNHRRIISGRRNRVQENASMGSFPVNLLCG